MTTLAQIAEFAGVSVKTVSRALNSGQEAKYAPTARRFAEIRRLADELGYRPNGSAKAMRSGRFNAIGLLLSPNTHERNLPDQLLSGICGSAGMRDQNLMVSIPTMEQIKDVEGVPRLVRELSCDGLLINYTYNMPLDTQRVIEKNMIPAIYLNQKLAHDCVRPDDWFAGADATRHLLGLGHRRIALLNTVPSPHYSVKDREAGYRAAMEEAGCAPHLVLGSRTDTMDPVCRYQMYQELIARSDRPTAFVASTGHDLMSLVRAAASRGLSVPQDLSVVHITGKQDRQIGRTITSHMLAEHEVGGRAVERLIQKIQNPKAALPAVVVPGAIVGGDSTAPV